MAKPKPQLIIGVILGTLVVAAGVLVPWYFYVYKKNPYPTWDLEFFGDTVEQSVNVSYGDIRDELVAFEYAFNHTRWWSPDGYLSEIRNYTGVPLWDLIVYSGVDYGMANALRFVAADDWTSPSLSLDFVQNNKSLIIVYYKEEGEILTGPEDEGDGYLMSAVNYSIDETVKSSHYNMKWLVGVEFVVDWEVTLFGFPFVKANKTISYDELLHEESLVRVNTLLNYTDTGSVLRNVTGVTLWSILEYTEVNYTTATHINFVSSDGFSTYNVSLSNIENYADKVLIVYEEDGELMDAESSGYIMSLVDYSITELYPIQQSGKYNAKFLNGIEFISTLV